MATKARIHDAKKIGQDPFVGGIWFACSACRWQTVGHRSTESKLQEAADKHNQENNK